LHRKDCKYSIEHRDKFQCDI